MTIQQVVEILHGNLVSGKNQLSSEVVYGFSSDLMSDVLTLEKEKIILLTGLANVQTIRTSEMSNINCIILVRNKKATPEMIKLAEETGIALVEFPGSMFHAVSILSVAGIKPVY